MLSDSDIDKAQERLEYILATYPEVADKYSEGDEEFCARLEDLCTNSSFDIKTFSVESLYSSGAVQGTSWDKITPSSNQQSSSTQSEVSDTPDEVIDLWGTTDEVNNSDVQQAGNIVSDFEGSDEIDLFGEEDIANNVNNVENSVESVENNTAEYTDLGGAFDDFDNSVENSVESVENSVENSVETVENYEASVENPVESVENSGSSVENPVETVENPVESIENSDYSAENPVETVENYDPLAESTSSSLEGMLGLGVFDDFFAPVTAPFDASKTLSHSDERSSSDTGTSLLVQADYYADDMDDSADNYGTIPADFKSEILERFYASNTEWLASITGIILAEEITVPLSLKATHLSPAFINYIRSYLASLDEDLDGLCETFEDLQTLITTDFNMLGIHQVHSLLTRWGSPYEKLSVEELSDTDSPVRGTMADLDEPLEDFFEGSDISDVVSSSDTQSVSISQPSMEGELGYNYDEVTNASSLYAMLTSLKPQSDTDDDDDELDIEELAEFVNNNADFDDEFEQDYDISSIVKEQGGLVSKLDDIPGDDSGVSDSENDNISFDDIPAEDEDEIDLSDNAVEFEDADFDELDDNFDNDTEEADAKDIDFDEPDEDIATDTEDSEEPEGDFDDPDEDIATDTEDSEEPEDDFDEPDEEPINGSSLGFSLSDDDLKACPYELGSKEFVEWINAKYKEFVDAKMRETQSITTSGITDADFDDVEEDDETSEIEDAQDIDDFDDPEEESDFSENEPDAVDADFDDFEEEPEFSEDEPDAADADFDDVEGVEDDLEDESEIPDMDFDDVEGVEDDLEDESDISEGDFDDIEDEDMPDDDASEDDFDDVPGDGTEDDFDDVLGDGTEDDLENDDSDADFDDILGDDTEDESESDSSDADFDDLESSEDDDLDAILGISSDVDEEDSSSSDEDFDEPDADFDEDTSSDEPDGEFDDIEDDSDTSLDDILGISSDEDSQSSVEYDDFSDVDELIDDAYSAMENNPLSTTDLGVPETSIKRVPITAEEKNEAAAEAILSIFNRLVSSPKAAKRVFDNIITKEGD